MEISQPVNKKRVATAPRKAFRGTAKEEEPFEGTSFCSVDDRSRLRIIILGRMWTKRFFSMPELPQSGFPDLDLGYNPLLPAEDQIY